jgi:hypothetical protein
MELTTKPDWAEAEARMEAWWAGDVLDRPALLVKAPRTGVTRAELDALLLPTQVPPDKVLAWFTDVARVAPRCEQVVDATFWGGEAFPVVYPVATRLVAITAAYLGCPYHVDPISQTGWADPIIDDWAQRPRLDFDPHNAWWQLSRTLLETVAQRAPGRFYVGLPDLNAPAQALAQLRGMQRMAIDLIDDPAPVAVALEEVNHAWYRYWQAATGAIHQGVGGYFYWMGLWSDRPSIDLQCDFNVLVSPGMFERYFLPGLEQQTRWFERTIFHLDGPEAIRHLDALLALPRLGGIQWVPGDGKPPMSRWLPLLRRVQARGKRLVLYCQPWEVETLVRELEPEGLLLSTNCDTQAEAEELLRRVPGWRIRRRWFVE